jgi:hypothetical protein
MPKRRSAPCLSLDRQRERSCLSPGGRGSSYSDRTATHGSLGANRVIAAATDDVCSYRRQQSQSQDKRAKARMTLKNTPSPEHR